MVSLVCLGNSSLVNMTIVNGKIVVRDGKLMTIDSDKIAASAHNTAAEIVRKQRESVGKN